jgi:hypothetical protein
MIELRLHREVYDGKAVDRAAKVFAELASFELALAPERWPAYWVVRVTCAEPAREREIAGELGNYALGLTVASHGAGGAAGVGEGGAR